MSYILMPWEGSHTIFSFIDAFLMYLIMHRIPANFTYLMITHLGLLQSFGSSLWHVSYQCLFPF